MTMMKKVRAIQNCEEVLLAHLITPKKRNPKFPKLEPIIEEGFDEGFEALPKRVLFLLPILFPTSCCIDNVSF